MRSTKCTAEPHSFLVNDATLASDNPLRFRKNLFNIFTYSPLGKAFEKQIKATEDQGTKLAKALENLKPKEQKGIEDESDDKLLVQKETYNRLLREILDEIREISKEIDFNNLTYHFKTPGISPKSFIKFKAPLVFFKEIKKGNISLTQAEEDKMNLNQILVK